MKTFSADRRMIKIAMAAPYLERQEEQEFKKLDQLIRQQQSFRRAAADHGPVSKLRRIFLPA